MRRASIRPYLQDNWRITRRLTLTPGVRWDINPAFTEKNNLLSAFDLESRSLVFPEPLDYYYKLGVTNPQVVGVFERVGVQFKSAEELGKSKQLFPSNYFEIRPRVGFAYNLTRGESPLVIRGGYGLYISAPVRPAVAAALVDPTIVRTVPSASSARTRAKPSRM